MQSPNIYKQPNKDLVNQINPLKNDKDDRSNSFENIG